MNRKIAVAVALALVVLVCVMSYVHERQAQKASFDNEQGHIDEVTNCMILTGNSSTWCEQRVG